jgi:stage III sporulation protein AH
MPSDMLVNTNKDNDIEVTIQESEILVALRVEANDQLIGQMEDLRNVLTDVNTTIDEKNNAFEKMKLLNINRGEEEKLETKIKDDFNLQSFVKINGDQIRVVVAKAEHDVKVANDIMRLLQSNFTNKMYISVKFQK